MVVPTIPTHLRIAAITLSFSLNNNSSTSSGSCCFTQTKPEKKTSPTEHTALKLKPLQQMQATLRLTLQDQPSQKRDACQRTAQAWCRPECPSEAVRDSAHETGSDAGPLSENKEEQ